MVKISQTGAAFDQPGSSCINLYYVSHNIERIWVGHLKVELDSGLDCKETEPNLYTNREKRELTHDGCGVNAEVTEFDAHSVD